MFRMLLALSVWYIILLSFLITLIHHHRHKLYLSVKTSSVLLKESNQSGTLAKKLRNESGHFDLLFDFTGCISDNYVVH